MKTRTRIALAIFAILSLADVVSLAFGDDTIHNCIKPLLIPSLAAAAFLELLPAHKSPLVGLLASALFFHTAGDILLMFDSSFVFFALGLGAFLIGHIFYLALLLRGMGGLKGWKEILCIVVPMLIASILPGIFGLEWPMSAAVAVYGLTLMYVCASGVLWKLRNHVGAWYIIFGALLFIISDSLIAISTFSGIHFALRHALVMGTYLLAQYLLVKGIIKGVFKKG